MGSAAERRSEVTRPWTPEQSDVGSVWPHWSSPSSVGDKPRCERASMIKKLVEPFRFARLQVGVALVTFLACVPLALAVSYYVAGKPAVVLVNSTDLSSAVLNNGMIDLMQTVDRSKLCDSKAERWLYRDVQVPVAGKVETVRQVVAMNSPDTVPTDIGVGQKYILSLPVPKGLTPGKWFYFVRLYDSCGWLPNFLANTQIRQSKPVPIDIP